MPKNNPPAPPEGSRPPFPPNWKPALLYLALALMLLWGWQEAFTHVAVRNIPYSEFKRAADAGAVTEVLVSEQTVEGLIDPTKMPAPAVPVPAGQPVSEPAELDVEGADKPWAFRAVRVEDPKLVEQLLAKEVKIVGQRPGFLSQFLWAWLVPMLVIFLVISFVMRRMGGAGKGMLSVGQSRAKLVADTDVKVRFEDVAGCDEAKAELREVVEFLRTPERYREIGAKMPRGVLLVGPPGTGKTLLARAVAGEADVPFYQLSGSDFVEMFVGVGAARVRDLFVQAKKNAPCIVFIDELDAVGRQRGVHVGASNDEREQTLNQLLVEMDGFAPNSGVMLLAATNRPDVLDTALLRPGRFDRQVVIDAPDLEGREAILRVHSAGRPMAADVNLTGIARATPGFSGADLANVINEASLLAVRRGDTEVHQADMEEAIEKVIAGPERRTRRLDPTEKRRVAFHEVGHALVALRCPDADPVHKISIVPRGRAALGYTMQRPLIELHILTQAALLDRLRGLLGGRAAEELVFGDVSTGASNDLEKATQIARRMVTMYGMSTKAGLAHTGLEEGGLYSGRGGLESPIRRDCSEETARIIDAEVRDMLDRAYADARRILAAERPTLDRIAAVLLETEVIEAEQFQQLAAGPRLSPDGESKVPPAA